MKLDLYLDKVNNNVVEVINGVDMKIDGLEKLVLNTTDAAIEKHVPILSLKDDNVLYVQVGSVTHPMQEEHLIQTIYIVCDDMFYKKVLNANEEPEITIALGNTKKVEVYAYCNLHGLWKATLEI